MVALIYVIEWQKQEPPHAHILGICDNANKPKTIDDYDSTLYVQKFQTKTHSQICMQLLQSL